MSIDAYRWAWKKKLEIVEKGSQRSTLKLILLALADRASENHEAWGKIKRLSLDTTLNPKTITTGLAKLERLGIIWDTGKREGKTNKIPVYKLIGVSGREDKPDEEPPQNGDDSDIGIIPDLPTETTHKWNDSDSGTIPTFPDKSPKNGVTNSADNSSINREKSTFSGQVHDINSDELSQDRVHDMDSSSSFNTNKTTTTKQNDLNSGSGEIELVLPPESLVNSSGQALASRILTRLPPELRQLVADEWHGRLLMADSGQCKPIPSKMGYLNTLVKLALDDQLVPSAAVYLNESRKKATQKEDQQKQELEAVNQGEQQKRNEALEQYLQMSESELDKALRLVPEGTRERVMQQIERYRVELGQCPIGAQA